MGTRDAEWINLRDVGSLQEALDALPSTGGTVYVPAGTFTVSETALKCLAEGQHLFIVGDGRSSVLVNANRDGAPLLQITGILGSWWPDLRITIRDLCFQGNHESGDALVIQSPNDTMIDGCAFFGHGGAAIRMEPNGTNVVVRDCWARDCKRFLSAVNIHHITLHGNQTRSAKGGQTQDEHIYIGRDCFEIRIVNNHLAYGHKEGILLEDAHQHVLANNTLEGFPCGVRAVNCRDIVLDANYLRCRRAIQLEGQCNGFTIAGNICQEAPEGTVVMVNAAGSGTHAITGNVMRASTDREGVTGGGIDLGESERCVVSGNLIEESTTMPAISAGPGGGYHLIANNSITRCLPDALAVDDAPGCIITGNLIL